MRTESILVLILLAGATQGCGTTTAAATRPANPLIQPSSRPVYADDVPALPPGLVAQLSRPEMLYDRRGWDPWFAKTRDANSKPFDPARRDAWFADVSRAAARRRDAVSVLVVEEFQVATPIGGKYDGVGLYYLPVRSARDERLDELGLVRVDDPPQWGRMSEWSNRLLRSGAPAAPEKMIFDIVEGTVVSRLDGGRWECGSWLYLSIRSEISRPEPERAEDLLPETRARFNLLQLVNRSLRGLRPPLAEDFLGPLVEQFGEFGREGGGASPPRTP